MSSVDDILLEKVKKFEDFKKQLLDLNNKIGAMKEQQKAIYNEALVIKGAIDGLTEVKMKEDEKLKESKTAQLVLPEGVKPVVAETAAPAAEAPAPVEAQ